MQACTEHHYVADTTTGGPVSRHCVYCGQARWVSKLLGLVRPAQEPAKTPAQVANDVEWAALNTPISDIPEPTPETPAAAA